MVLKKITLRGFKSFADKTELEFKHGVTCIVGPNGCGKSNILDSIRWVLGEQNPRHLRGLQMQNVIFDGTQSRRAEGLAEVSLLLDNSNGVFPVEYTEILVTRRLFRSGESEYLLNKTICRLKDIIDLFLDTGIGKSTYSIIEQGKVEQILNSRPMDRRAIFEEAAGISKYKVRRDEAIRKLTRTEQDLIRLNDILAELGRQVRSLKRQAGLAERYEQYFQKLQALDLTLLARKAHQLEQQIVEAQKERQVCEDEKQEISAARATAHAELVQTAERLAALDEKIHQLAEKQIALRGEMERWDEKAQSATQRQSELRERDIRLTQEIEDSRNRLNQFQIALTEWQKKTETEEKEVAKAAEEKALMDQRIEQLTSLVAKQEITVEELRQSLLRLQNELTAGENDQRRIERERELISAQGQKLTQQQLLVAEEVTQLETLIRGKETRANEIHSTLDQLDLACQTASGQLEQTNSELEACCARLNSLQTEIHAGDSRLSSQIELERNREGHNDGVKFLLEERGKTDSTIRPECLGTLADLMTVENGYEVAIETALAYTLQYLMVEHEEEAARLLKVLSQNQSGRAGFVPLDTLTPSTDESLPENTDNNNLRRAVEIVRFPETHQRVAQLLFGDILIAPDLNQARQARKTLKGQWRIITLQGEMIDAQGILSGGSHTEGGLLSRKRDIAELQTRLEQARQEQSSIEQERVELKERLDQLRRQLEADHEQRHQTQIQRAKVDEEMTALTRQKERLMKDRDGISQEQIQRAQELSCLMEDARNVNERVDRYRQEFNQSSGLFEQEEALLNEKKQQIRELEIERHQKTVFWVEKRKDLERGHAEIQSLTEQMIQSEQLITNRSGEKQTIAEHYEQAAEQILASKKKAGEILDEIQILDESIAEHRRQRLGLADLRTHQEEKLEEVDTRRRGLDEKTVELESTQVRLNLQKEDLARRLKNEFEKDYSECEGMDRQEERPQEEIESEAETLRNRIQRLGPVNRLAKEEYEEVNQRFEFLSKQKEDLEKARANLLRTISEIKRTARERFQNVFGQIQENFRKTFRTMFGGGKADLLLLDEEDVIESGVEIVAQPPGKNLQSISLMSGGEKALTAISLIFAIYLIKPSPFCVLDEIDAPLDDINVGRFTRVLQQYTDKSQFLIITHNKRTMEMANMIYGVTMAEQGVSNIMSMNFETAHRHAIQGQTAIPVQETTESESSLQEDNKPEEEHPAPIINEEILEEELTSEDSPEEEDVPRAKNGTKLEPVTLDDEMTHFHEEDFVPHKEKVVEEE